MNAITEKIRTTLPVGLLGLAFVFSQLSCTQPPVAPVTQASPSPSVSPTAAAAADVPSMSGSSSSPSMTSTTKSPAGNAAGSSSSSAATTPVAPAQERAAVVTPPPPPPRTFTLTPGRTLAIYTANSLSSKTSKNGDVFVASLANPIVDGDWVIAKKGAQVEGVVSNSDPGGRIKGVASISVKLRSLQLADGRTVPISTSQYIKEAKSTKKKDAVKIGIGAGIGAAIGAIAGGGKGAAIGAGVGGGGGTAAIMATRGDPAVIPAESQLNFRLTSPVKVTKR
ncbi:MAG: hypothetical protein ABI882_01605 [Acidobacteriota bacterium]